MATVDKNVSVSAPVKERLVRDALERGASLNDVAVGILADRFRVAFEGTGRRGGRVVTTEGPLILRMPAKLGQKIDAAKSGRPRGSRTVSAVVESALREHFALDVAVLA